MKRHKVTRKTKSGKTITYYRGSGSGSSDVKGIKGASKGKYKGSVKIKEDKIMGIPGGDYDILSTKDSFGGYHLKNKKTGEKLHLDKGYVDKFGTKKEKAQAEKISKASHGKRMAAYKNYQNGGEYATRPKPYKKKA